MDQQTKQVIAEELNVDPGELTSEKRLEEIDTWDSVMVLSVMVILSEAAGREIPPAEMAKVKTFGDLEKLAAATSP